MWSRSRIGVLPYSEPSRSGTYFSARSEQMLDDEAFAFLTAEDEATDGKLHAREKCCPRSRTLSRATRLQKSNPSFRGNVREILEHRWSWLHPIPGWRG